MSEDKTKHQ